MSWSQRKLESLAANEPYSFIGGPFGSKLTSRDYVGEGVPVIRGSNLNNGRFLSMEDFVFVSDSKVREDLSSNLAKPGDMIFTQRGTLGQVAIIPQNGISDRYVVSQSQMKLTVDETKADKLFLYYHFSSREAVERILNLTSSSGVPHINLTTLRQFEFPFPPLGTQRSIASILSAYDDLIENNRRRIQLLEQAARLLYKEWFVHFRFPGHEHVKIIDGVPEGWERKTYSDLFKLAGGFAFKSKTYQPEGKYGIATIKNVHDACFIPECPSRLDEIPEKMKEHCVLETGDVLLSLTGNVGRACIVYGKNYFLNQRVAKIVGKLGIPRGFVYWTFSNETTQKELENLAYGVAQLNLSPVKLGAREFVKPTSELLELFTDFSEPIFEQICTLNLKVHDLTKARDLLLPRLMNGELTV